MKFKVGDKCLYREQVEDEIPLEYHLSEVKILVVNPGGTFLNRYWDYLILNEKTHVTYCTFEENLSLVTKVTDYNSGTIIPSKGGIMNNTIIKMFPKTEDAVLVEKHLGNNFNIPLLNLVAESHGDEILAFCKAMEAEEKKAEQKK